MNSREERAALRSLSPRAQQALDILRTHEQDEIEITRNLAAALETTPLTFVVFACLGTIRGKEELRLDLSETIFFRKFRRQAENLIRAMNTAKIPANLLVILPDLEPRRTWGWQAPQEELSGLCSLLIEDAAEHLPQEWSVRRWSDIE